MVQVSQVLDGALSRHQSEPLGRAPQIRLCRCPQSGSPAPRTGDDASAPSDNSGDTEGVGGGDSGSPAPGAPRDASSDSPCACRAEQLQRQRRGTRLQRVSRGQDGDDGSLASQPGSDVGDGPGDASP